eukprot:4864979-Pleurochrysis_carterae.AAC.1
MDSRCGEGSSCLRGGLGDWLGRVLHVRKRDAICAGFGENSWRVWGTLMASLGNGNEARFGLEQKIVNVAKRRGVNRMERVEAKLGRQLGRDLWQEIAGGKASVKS